MNHRFAFFGPYYLDIWGFVIVVDVAFVVGCYVSSIYKIVSEREIQSFNKRITLATYVVPEPYGQRSRVDFECPKQ